MEWLTEINAWHWIALGLLLLGAEALGAAGFLLGTAVAALVVGLLTLVAPGLGLPAELTLFAALAVLASYLYLQVFRQEQAATPDDLNHRAGSLVGSEFALTEALAPGSGRIQIGDTFWRVETAAHLPAGTRVRVAAADAMTLTLIRAG